MDTNSPEIVFRRTKKVVLRPILEADIPLLLRWINDPEVTRFLKTYMPMTEADEREWVQNHHKRKPYNIVVMIVVDGVAIGTMGLHNIDYRSRLGTTGALIGEKEYWGKGYGSEAKMLLLDFAFNTLNLRKICSNVIAFNERSLKYSLKCGYKEEARLKKHHYADGKYWDKLCLAVFREDWEPLWEQFAQKHGLVLPE